MASAEIVCKALRQPAVVIELGLDGLGLGLLGVSPEEEGSMHHGRIAAMAAMAMFIVALATPAPVRAQAVTGTLLGNVTDGTGGALPGATVTATETKTNVSRTVVSNEAGYYIFSSLLNGTYIVTGRAAGLPEGRPREREGRRQHDDPRGSRRSRSGR